MYLLPILQLYLVEPSHVYVSNILENNSRELEVVISGA